MFAKNLHISIKMSLYPPSATFYAVNKATSKHLLENIVIPTENIIIETISKSAFA